MKEQLQQTQRSLASLQRKNKVDHQIAYERLVFAQKKLDVQQKTVEALRRDILDCYDRLNNISSNSNFDVERYQQILNYIDALQLKLQVEDAKLTATNKEVTDITGQLTRIQREKKAFTKKQDDTGTELKSIIEKEIELDLTDIWLNKERRYD